MSKKISNYEHYQCTFCLSQKSPPIYRRQCPSTNVHPAARTSPACPSSQTAPTRAVPRGRPSGRRSKSQINSDLVLIRFGFGHPLALLKDKQERISHVTESMKFTRIVQGIQQIIMNDQTVASEGIDWFSCLSTQRSKLPSMLLIIRIILIMKVSSSPQSSLQTDRKMSLTQADRNRIMRPVERQARHFRTKFRDFDSKMQVWQKQAEATSPIMMRKCEQDCTVSLESRKPSAGVKRMAVQIFDVLSSIFIITLKINITGLNYSQ